jgi:K+-transporting ATPase ATPase A chain
MWQGLLQIALTLLPIGIITPILGKYMAGVFRSTPDRLDQVCSPLERGIYRFSQIDSSQMMTGWQYARAIFVSNLVMAILVVIILMTQGGLPFNSTGLSAPTWDTALHTTISFLTNTDQQHYAGETTFSYASQVLGLGFLMFTSAATGLSVGIAFIRGLTGKPLGNFYVDLVRSITRILLPISILIAVLLLIAGVPETLSPPVTVTTLEGAKQVIALGPIAHFESIKQLGENGGGFFGANSAHPFENPNGFANLVATIAMISIPTALIHTYGIFANNTRQSWLILSLIHI